MWKDGNVVYYETKTKERGAVAVKGFVEFNDLAKLWSIYFLISFLKNKHIRLWGFGVFLDFVSITPFFIVPCS